MRKARLPIGWRGGAGGGALGQALAQVIQTLDPGRLLVVLDPVLSDRIYGMMLRRTVAAHVLPGSFGSEVELAGDIMAVPDIAWASGAAGGAAHRFLVGSITGQ